MSETFFTTEDGEVLAEFPCMQCGEDTWFGVDDDPSTYVCNSCRETSPAPTPALLRAWAELPEFAGMVFGPGTEIIHGCSAAFLLRRCADALERAEENS